MGTKPRPPGKQTALPTAIDAETETDAEKPRLLSLKDCYALALKRSETVAIRKEAIEEAEAQFFKAAAVVLGDVDYVWTDFMQEELKGERVDPESGSGVQTTLNDPERVEKKFVVKQPLFQGFKSIASLRGAGHLKQQRVDEQRRAEQILFQEVSGAYYQIFQNKKDIEIIEGILRLFAERIRDLEEREKIGRSRVSELATAKAKMKILEADLARARGALLISQHLLEFLTGIPISVGQLAEETGVDPDGRDLPGYLQAAQQRPDVEAARHAVELAWNKVVVSQSGFWPEVTLESRQYERREGFQSGIDWDVLFTATVPLFRGGQNLGNLKEALSQWKQAKLKYGEVKRRTEFQIKESYRFYETSKNQYFSLQEAVLASEQNFRLQKQDYSFNLVSNLDVLDSLEELNSTQREKNRIFYNMKQNYWRLRVAAGEAP